MVSLAEARLQVAELAEQVGKLNLSYRDLRMIEATATGILRTFSKMTGSEEVDAIISKLQRVIMVARMAQASIHAFQIASGPIGWAFAAVGIVGTAITVGETLYDLDRGT